MTDAVVHYMLEGFKRLEEHAKVSPPKSRIGPCCRRRAGAPAGAAGLIALTIKSGAGHYCQRGDKKARAELFQVVSMAALFPMQWPRRLRLSLPYNPPFRARVKAVVRTVSCRGYSAEAFYQQVGFAVALYYSIVLHLVWRAARMAKCKCRWTIQNVGLEEGRPASTHTCAWWRGGVCHPRLLRKSGGAFLGGFVVPVLPHGRQAGAGHARLRARG